MTETERPAAKKAAATKADPPPAAAKTAEEPKAATEVAVLVEEGPRVSTCVVDNGRGQHVGNAVNGKVCSYHAMHYAADGSRR